MRQVLFHIFLSTWGTRAAATGSLLASHESAGGVTPESLSRTREITFEEIVFHIEKGDVLDVLEHPNQERYPTQRVQIVDVNDYAFLVPYVESDEIVFLKTITPSRKATRKYLGDA